LDREPVLIADEDADDRRQLAELLEHAGFDVVETSSGDEALQLIRENRHALAILEMPLGEISGTRSAAHCGSTSTSSCR
jgi:CheY-like chemotaxis protein